MTGLSNIMTVTNLDMTSIVFCFPDLRREFTAKINNKILLWHSSTVFMIWRRRRDAIRYPYDRGKSPVVFDYHQRLWRPELHRIIKETIESIYQHHKVNGKTAIFRTLWIQDCSLWTVVSDGFLQYHSNCKNIFLDYVLYISSGRPNGRREDEMEVTGLSAAISVEFVFLILTLTLSTSFGRDSTYVALWIEDQSCPEQ